MENSSENKSENNVLSMYEHPDWCYRPARASLLYTSWLLFKRIFKLAFNGFAKPDGKKIDGALIEKILSVGYVLFTLLGPLALLIALGVFFNAGIGSLFFIFLGIGSSLLGIIAIGTIILGAVVRKNMYEDKIYVYYRKTEVYYVRENAKLYINEQVFQPYDLKNINTRNLIIPESQVYSQEDFKRNL